MSPTETPLPQKQRINCSKKLLNCLLKVSEKRAEPLYAVGGTVRDLLLNKSSQDLDLAVPGSARNWAEQLCSEIGAGTLIDLSGPEDEAVRVVWQKEQVDISSFRGNATSIEEDLQLRDFTINAVGVELQELSAQARFTFIDPTGGIGDLKQKIVRHLAGAFIADPVRMLRGYRLNAQLAFSMSEETRNEVRCHKALIKNVAVERVAHELELIFESDCTSITLEQMDKDGLLKYLLPELCQGQGVEQPEFHHLDVLDHCFLALKMMEEIIASPALFFPLQQEVIAEYLNDRRVRRCLKWAALMHDVGKPGTRETKDDGSGRVTFYRHDEVGRTLFAAYAERSHWSRLDSDRVAGLIGMHMHPFHLCNVQREAGITKRAALKISNRAGKDLIGLFLLAMSDSLASSGVKKPEKMEEELVELFTVVEKIFLENIQPVLQGPKLINGKDLIEHFELEPGPTFSIILQELEVARVEGEVETRADALSWVEKFLLKE